MNYIINPSWFYWISVVESIQILAIFAAIILGIGWVLIFFSYTIDGEGKKRTLVLMALLIVSLVLIAIFIPSKETLIQMKIAEFATYDNAKITIDTIKSAADYILECLKQLK